MALLQVELPFPAGRPSIEDLRQTIQARTGLDVMIDCLNVSCICTHPDVRDGCEFQIHDGMVYVYANPGGGGYMTWAVIAALVDLGGICPRPLPWFVNVKWRDRKWWQRLHARV